MSEDSKQGATPQSERTFDAFAVRKDKGGQGNFQNVGLQFATSKP